MNTTKKIKERLTRLKWYYVALIVIAPLYLLTNTIVVWAPTNNITIILMGLITWALLIGSVVLLILTIVDSITVNREKPEYKFSIQYIVASVLLGALAFFVLLSLAVVSHGDHDVSTINNTSVGIKMITWLISSLIVGGIILFYVLSLQKSIGSLKDISRMEDFRNDETPKEEEKTDEK